MDLKISKTTQLLSSSENMRNQTKLIMQPYANWEEYLTPAPLSIAIMGELVFISSAEDFSINKNSPEGGYKFIKYPESFRACLMQVCNSGWWAFNEAHTSMDQIRLQTAQVPDYLKMAVKILFQDNDEVIQAHLSDQLNNIRVIADECLALSSATKDKFSDVIKIIQELLEACVNAQHFYGEEMEVIKKKIEENKLRENSAQQIKKMTKATVAILEEQLKSATTTYNKAMGSFPDGWESIAMDIVDGLTQSLIALISGLASNICNPINTVERVAENIASHPKSQETIENINAQIISYSKSASILNCVQRIMKEMNVRSEDDKIDWNNLYDQKQNTTKSDFLADQFKRINEELNKISDCKAKVKAQELCQKGIEICHDLAKHAPEGKCDKEVNRKIIEEVFELISSARVFDSKSKDITKSSAFSSKSPMMSKIRANSDPQNRVENARFIIEQSRAQLNKTREDYDKSMESLKRNEKELTEILVSMRKFELKEIDFKTTTEMLVKGMDAMGRVKEQWEKMVHFFQIVSNIVKTNLSTILNNFVSTAGKTQTLSYNSKLFSKDLLYTQAFKASDIANLVNMISGTYTEISTKYLMDRVSSLGKLMAMDKSKPEFEQERSMLQQSCDEAQKKITELVQKNKEEFERKCTERQQQIDRELLAILPAAPPEQTKRIQDDVKAGFSGKEVQEDVGAELNEEELALYS